MMDLIKWGLEKDEEELGNNDEEDDVASSEGDESLIANLASLIQEDERFLEEAEEEGVVNTILRMSSQSTLEGWRKGKKEIRTEELTVFS